MNWIIENEKKVVMGLLVIILLLAVSITSYVLYKNYLQTKIDKGIVLYDKMHDLYFFGGSVDFDFENEIDGYINIKNYEEIEKLVSEKTIEKVNSNLNIKKIDDSYYMYRVGKGLSNYYGTELKVKKIRKNKLVYSAITKLCKLDSIVAYGNGCKEEEYYTIEKPFTIVKEDGKWKVLEYTSIFQFSDKELK